MKKISTCVLLALLFTGCIKSTKLRYAGLVVDSQGIPINKAVVVFIAHRGASRFSDGEFGPLAKHTTDIHGRFNFTARAQVKLGIEFQFSAPGHQTVKFKDTLGASQPNMFVVLK